MTHKIKNSICIGCGHLEQETTTQVCCPDNKYVTIQEFLNNYHEQNRKWAESFKKLQAVKDSLMSDEELEPRSSDNDFMEGWREGGCEQKNRTLKALSDE